ncbi:ubiquitin carboxyl-terminal hydrolase 19-like isoform X2 [Tubulanus polymorphus]|uniref:ubiquitin carboxyl-terminal hydrolase 19-like isoform X2 n=1 Tax=Tubulanus polymorphus TaxID=672921 RepID=UPI003DA5BA68
MASDNPEETSGKPKCDQDETVSNKQKRMDSEQVINHDWSQTQSDVTVQLYVGFKLKTDDLDVVFTADGVHLKLKDGREWKHKLSESIVQEESRVIIKKQKVVLHLKKQKQKEWISLIAEDNKTVELMETEEEKVDSPEKEKLLESSILMDQQIPDEVLYTISHAKNSYFEKDKDLMVTIFIKTVNKETLVVNFEEKMLSIKFQTSDAKFLQLHENTDCKTIFFWPLNLREEIIPDQCRYKVNSSLIELALRKKISKRWVALEAPASTETSSSSPTDKWVPLGNRNKTSTAIPLPPPPPPPITAKSSVAFDEMAENINKITTKSTTFSNKDIDSNITQKPTCMVSPLNKSDAVSMVTPGLTGLDNLGNTCFMSSVIQCLANTRELRDYFLDSSFQKEINCDNPLGSGGRLATAFAVLLRVLWSGKHTSYAPSKLKNLIAMKASQFTGFAQHDAQELMAFLLDGLHEMQVFEVDKSKIYKFYGKNNSLASVSATDIVIACEILSEDLAGEPVYVIPVIQRTLLPPLTITKCSYCKHECPPGGKLKRCTRCFKAAYCDQNCQKNHWRTHCTYCKHIPESVGLPFIISIPESQATYSRLTRTMEQYARYSVDVFQPPTQLPESAGPSATISSASNEELSDNPVDNPFQTNDGPVGCSSPTTSKRRDNRFTKNTDKNDTELDEKMDQSEKEKRTGLVLGTSHELEHGPVLFYIKPVNQYGQGITDINGARLQDQGDEPLDLSSKYYLSMDWRNNDKESPYVLVQSKEFDCNDDEDSIREAYGASGEITLEHCLNMFTEPETLSPEEAWYCPQCKEHREATKQMSIWRLPHTLIIQLKRFSFRNFIWRDKIDKLVEFPIRGLDLTKHFVGSANEPPPIYDLYAVINHYGGILGGHYTAFARCPDPNNPSINEQGWRLFDDSHVTARSERSVMTKGAYVLFYRRRHAALNISPQNQLSTDNRKTYDKEQTTDVKETTTSSTSTSSDDDFIDSFQDQSELKINKQDQLTKVKRPPGYKELGYTDVELVD